MENTKWYIINAFNGKEKKVKEKIEKELKNTGMDKYVKEFLIPREKYYQIRNGKKVKSERNFFPGYIMIECVMNGELVRTIKNVDGVIGFLGSESPVPMKDVEVNRMLKTIDDMHETTATMDTTFILGEEVTIIDGPFTSFHGQIEKFDMDRKRIVVSVTIFGRKTPVELGYEQISK